MWVASHKMPPSIPGTRKWDKRAIDARLDEISGLGVKDNNEDEFDRWERRQRDETDASQPAVLSNYDDWFIKKTKRREKYRPQLGLDAKLERVIMSLANHPELDTVSCIAGAGPSCMDHLIDMGAVRLADMEDEKTFRYALTEEGAKEVHRIRKWRALAP
jgi:hypothetical protein